jgi:hypothetical protein
MKGWAEGTSGASTTRTQRGGAGAQRSAADKSNADLSVLVSGEWSGAGRTGACKHMIRYFAQSSQAVAEADAMEASPASAPGGGARPSTARSRWARSSAKQGRKHCVACRGPHPSDKPTP